MLKQEATGRPSTLSIQFKTLVLSTINPVFLRIKIMNKTSHFTVFTLVVHTSIQHCYEDSRTAIYEQAKTAVKPVCSSIMSSFTDFPIPLSLILVQTKLILQFQHKFLSLQTRTFAN